MITCIKETKIINVMRKQCKLSKKTRTQMSNNTAIYSIKDNHFPRPKKISIYNYIKENEIVYIVIS